MMQQLTDQELILKLHENKIRYDVYCRLHERLHHIEELNELFPEIVGLEEWKILAFQSGKWAL